MNRENFFRKYDKIVAGFGDTKPSILLHSCCGPCSSSVIELLSQHFDVTVLWYNPNLWPEEEFEKRLATQKQLISCLAEDGICAGLLTLPWRSEDYFSRIKGLENEPEEGKRDCAHRRRARLSLVLHDAHRVLTQGRGRHKRHRPRGRKKVRCQMAALGI